MFTGKNTRDSGDKAEKTAADGSDGRAQMDKWTSCMWQNLYGQAWGVRAEVRDYINQSFRN